MLHGLGGVDATGVRDGYDVLPVLKDGSTESFRVTADMHWSAILNKYFSVDLPFARYCRNVLVFTCICFLPFLAAFVALSPEFGTMLITNGTALSRFIRQLLTNGVPVIFVVNYAGFFSAAVRRQTERHHIRYLMLDGFLRALMFIGLHALIYVLSADLFGSFGEDRGTALQVVGPTLERSFLFENISGVYLYSTLPGAFIVYLDALQQQKRATPARPSFGMDAMIALSLCVFIVLTVTLLSAGLTYSLGRP